MMCKSNYHVRVLRSCFREENTYGTHVDEDQLSSCIVAGLMLEPEFN